MAMLTEQTERLPSQAIAKPPDLRNTRGAMRVVICLFCAVVSALSLFVMAPAGVDAADEPPPDVYLPQVSAPAPRVIIAAVHIDSAISYEPDEAVLLWNIGGRAQALAGWQISTASRRASFPITSTLTLGAGQRVWCAAEDAAFRQSFGHTPVCAWDVASEPSTVELDGSLSLTNYGGHIQLRDAQGRLMDALLYGDVDHAIEGWTGPAAQAYTRGAIGSEGQVWQRKRDPATTLSLDSDAASDWAGDLADVAWGRRVSYPGWPTDAFVRPAHSVDTATVTVAVAPEGLYAPVNEMLASAQHTIDVSLYVLEHPQLAQTIAEAAQRGVRVRLLLEGSPVGGVTDLQRWCVRHIAASGGVVRYMAVVDGAPRGYDTRYRYAHAKYGIVDGQRSLVGTENLTLEAAPVPRGEPSGGRRGFFLLTDAPSVAQSLTGLFETDWQPERFLDLRPYEPGHPVYGDPPAGYVLPGPPVYPVDTSPFADPALAHGPTRFVVVSAPDNALRPDDGLFALLDRAGTGDEIFVTQLYEHTYWGDANSNPVADPNPRLERLIDAARRGVRVRLLLDSRFDEPESPRSNRATADYVRAIAAAEGLDLDARLADPAGGGLHGKLVLVRLGDETWSAVGSLNGGEISYKVNREVTLLVDHPAVYDRLLDVFRHDWSLVIR